LLQVPAGGGGAASSVVGCQDPVLRRRSVREDWYQVTVYLLPPLQPACLAGDWATNVLWSPVLCDLC